jgi:hypothetical protein
VPDLVLERAADDRRRYVIDGVGSVRLEGLFTRSGIAEAAGASWRFATRGLLRRVVVATDVSGTEVGRFDPGLLRSGGIVTWGDRELRLDKSSIWRQRYVLVDGERELARLDGKGWGRKPVTITVDDHVVTEPGLVLFVAYVVRGLAADSSAGDGGGGATFSSFST